MIAEQYAPGMAAMAAPVMRRASQETVGVITIAGPLMRLTQQRMTHLGAAIMAAASELRAAGATSPLFAAPRRMR
jgi:IclR family acetate operon transcriptional repressor